MQQFITTHQEQIQGVISGFDRLVFHGHLRTISSAQGMKAYLDSHHILLKDYGQHVLRVSERLKQVCQAAAEAQRRPVIYLPSGKQSKEELARSIAARDRVRSGLICLLTTIEVCWSFRLSANRQTRRLLLTPCTRKCLHLYQYWMHPQFGFCGVRLQSWFPFAIQICLNGREWLAGQMETAGLRFLRQDNCFPWIEDYDRAQQLLDQQLTTDWPRALHGMAAQIHPLAEEIFAPYAAHYYWSTYQSEWATDLVFADAQALRRLYPKLLHHGITTFSSPDVLRFLGKPLPLSGRFPRHWKAELATHLGSRSEGTRIRHTLNGNSIKLYDKAFTPHGSVLRAETTIQREADFRVWRPKQGGPAEDPAWRKMRRGVADLYRRAQVSQKANERYLDALATVEDRATVEQLLTPLTRPAQWRGKRIRALRLFDAAEMALLSAIQRPEFTLAGLRNRDLQRLLFDAPAATPLQRRRCGAWVSYRLRILRAHGLLRKIPHTHRYHLTASGRAAITALLAVRQTAVADLPVAA
jgi:hypothetical protein